MRWLKNGSPGRDRTCDMVINSHPLCRLSYRGSWEGKRLRRRVAGTRRIILLVPEKKINHSSGNFSSGSFSEKIIDKITAQIKPLVSIARSDGGPVGEIGLPVHFFITQLENGLSIDYPKRNIMGTHF